MLTEESMATEVLGGQPEYQLLGEDGVVATRAVVLLVEADPLLRRQLLQALPQNAGAQAFPGLDELDGARFRPDSPLVLVLGPSQATAEGLERVSSVLKGTRGSGAVLVVEHPSAKLMSLALRSGVNDAIELSDVGAQLASAVSDLALQLDEDLSAPPVGQQTASPGRRRAFVTTVFSPKGGVGKSVVAVNLATALARRTGEPVVVLDLDLQFGDVAVMLRLQPVHTFTDAISAGDLLDETLLRSFLGRHEKSGVYVLAAPTSPSEADHVDPGAMLRVLDLLREMFSHVVIDTPPHLSEVVLQAVAESDAVGFVVAMDVPSVKNARLGLQAFSLLQIPLAKVVLLLNRAGSKVHLAPHDVERALEMKVDLWLPSDLTVVQSVNQGVPTLLAYPNSPFSGQVRELADLVLSRAEEASPGAWAAKR
jgi:pilus assembly protein CpaE